MYVGDGCCLCVVCSFVPSVLCAVFALCLSARYSYVLSLCRLFVSVSSCCVGLYASTTSFIYLFMLLVSYMSATRYTHSFLFPDV